MTVAELRIEYRLFKTSALDLCDKYAYRKYDFVNAYEVHNGKMNKIYRKGEY